MFRMKQFIPARGRKPRVEDFHTKILRETIHPRKGTETNNAMGNETNLRGNNSSPQGDGNSMLMNATFSTIETIHPRKGTETISLLM